MTTQPPHDPVTGDADRRTTEPGVEPVDTVDSVDSVVDGVGAAEDGPARGMRALVGEQFSIAEAVGGVRGMVESVAPGLVFVVVFVASRDLRAALVSAIAVALVAVTVRLVQRTPVTQAVGGVLGVLIGVVWAWRSGDAEDYFAWGLWTNAVYLVVLLVSLLVRWPLVGVVVEAFRSGFGGQGPSTAQGEPEPERDEPAAGAAAPTGAQGQATVPGGFAAWADGWRSNRPLVRRYVGATWLWVGLFAVRLAVQVPLYTHEAVGWLGTARLVMGLPLWALVLWLTWALVRRPAPVPGTPAA